MRRLTGIVLALVGVSPLYAVAIDHDYRRIAMEQGKLCIDSHLKTKDMKIEGILGSDLGATIRGVFVTYPMRGQEDLTIFVRPAAGYEKPLPALDEKKLHRLEGDEELYATEINARKAQTIASKGAASPVGRFVAVCQDLPIPRQCSRPFRYPGLVGTYSFKREQLSDWKIMEIALQTALSSREIANCDSTQK